MLGPLPKPAAEALTTVIEMAHHAAKSGLAYKREVMDLREVARRLEEMALRDPLTGLANRRAIDEKLAAEWERSRRYDRPLALLIADVDSLKAVNDTFGHQAGDRLLTEVGFQLTTLIRSGDVAGRVGGDEFVVICPETDDEAASVVAHKLMRSLDEASISTPRGVVEVHISIGWAGAADLAEPDELLRAADESLYRVKQARQH